MTIAEEKRGFPRSSTKALKRMLTVSALAVMIAATANLTSACTPRMVADIAGAAIVTAVIVGTAQAMAHHDAHFHDEYCGHGRRYHRGRWVYHYNDEWEYYDSDAQTWYYYRD